MDVEGGIKAGQDFVRVLEEQVSACDAMLVLIGPDWLTVKDEAGRPRLENPEDFVRIEVGSAVKFKRVIRCWCTRPRCRALTGMRLDKSNLSSLDGEATRRNDARSDLEACA
jgi:hypothetical protein